MLTATDLTIGYQPDRPVAGPLSFTASPGRIVGLIGASGAGKSTLLRTLAGLTAPLAGTVHRAGAAGLLAQHPRQAANPRWTLRRIIAEPARIAGLPCPVEDIADRAGLDLALLDRFPSQVSDGQLQRACIGRLYVQNPRIVLCDEPAAMLDPIAAAAVMDAIGDLAAHGAVVVLASHDHHAVRHLAGDHILTL